jgi:hypothetical protein
MKFSQIVLGPRAVQFIKLQHADNIELEMGVRPLVGAEEADILQRAIATTKEKGGEPRAGEELFDLHYRAELLAVACIDYESPENARTPYFDGGAAQVLKHLHPDVICYLAERQQTWQDECSPSMRRQDPREFLEWVREIAEAEDAGPFVRLRPGTRWVSTRSMAKLLQDFLTSKSPFTSLSELAEQISKTQTPKP